MTPVVLEYGYISRYVYELSKYDPHCRLEAFKLYGVSVKEVDGSDTDLSSCFRSLKDAVDYIESIGVENNE